MPKVFNRATKLAGESHKIGTPSVKVLEYDSDNNVLRATGVTVPTDADEGYAKGCIFIQTDGGVSDSIYINVGSATSANFDKVPPTGAPVNITTATLTVTEAAHANRTITLNRAAGIAVTLPAASGTGNQYRFVVGTTVTSNSTTVKVVADDTMTGLALVANDTDASTSGWETAADSDTITFNGSTTGGIKGDVVELEDIAADLWSVKILGSATGTEATPFSATVT